MFRNVTIGALALSSLALPAVATAQGYDDGGFRQVQYSRAADDIHDADRRVARERRDLDNARRYGDRGDVREQAREYRDARQDRRELIDDYRDGRRDGRYDRGDYRRYGAYDYNRPDPRYRGYYADNYYRDGRYYQPRRLGYNDRVYRGRDGRYYCRRSDGTTGLIIGGLGGGVLGNVIAPGGSKTLGTIIGGGLGAVLGNSIDRNNVTCR